MTNPSPYDDCRSGVDAFIDAHADKIAADPNTGCWHWTGACDRYDKPSGTHGRVRIDGVMQFAHRASFEAAHGPIPDGLIVRHRCDVPHCVNPDHLELGTRQDNVDDMMDRGRGIGPRVAPPDGPVMPSVSAERNGMARLDQAKIDAIRAMRKAGVSCSRVGDVFGVSKSYVSKVARGVRWLTPPPKDTNQAEGEAP